MNLIKIFSKSTLLLMAIASLTACGGEMNAVSEIDPGDRLEVEDGMTQTNVAIESKASVVAQDTGNVTIEEVANDSESLIGKTVTIRSEALETVEPASFIVGDQDFFGGEDVLILNASGEIFVLPEDDTEVQATGEVVQFVFADIESEYELDLDPELYVDYEDKPAIIAQSLALAPEPGEIAENPAQYYGLVLAVTGEIEAVYGENAFTLDEDELFGGEDLLVVVTNPTEAVIQDGETVAVSGQMRSLVTADMGADYDLTWDLDVQKELEVEYSERPVLVVDRVYPSAIPE